VTKIPNGGRDVAQASAQPRQITGAAVPPQNIEAEESVLGAMLVAEPALTRVDEVKLNAEDFYLEKHALIFACARDLYAASKPVDELSVSEALVQRGEIEGAGGKHYVSELAAKVPAAGNAKHYAEIVQQNSLLRRLLGAGQEIQGLVHSRNGCEPGELQAQARELLDRATSTITDAQTPAGALAAASVDLIATIRDGLPERAYVPGGESWLIAGKRYLLPAPAGTGKSLVSLIAGTEVVDAGGTAAILDVENGAEEYARRTADLLEARGGTDSELAAKCEEHLRYYAWPALRVTWGPEEWSRAFEDVDLAIFDSSRMMLSAAGLAEDSNDDYAAFVNGLLVPLARAGVTTMVLDNTGHEDRDRARGASAKADLNEVIYVVKVGEEFDRDQTGYLRLVRQRTRFAELPGELHVPLGGGTYGPIEEAEPQADSDGFRPTALMERASRAIEANPGRSRKEVLELVGGKREFATMALTLLVAEDFVRAETEGRSKLHYSTRLYREVDNAS
jgi:hypothetical protein